jgi:hypothetical protein
MKNSEKTLRNVTDELAKEFLYFQSNLKHTPRQAPPVSYNTVILYHYTFVYDLYEQHYILKKKMLFDILAVTICERFDFL